VRPAIIALPAIVALAALVRLCAIVGAGMCFGRGDVIGGHLDSGAYGLLHQPDTHGIISQWVCVHICL
jgi:hypothetical protein